MDRYKKLLSNTMIFAIGTFGSKMLVFLLMPLYTRVLSQSQYGTVDLIVQASNLLIPIASIGINNSIIRFGLERNINKKGVMTVGLLTILSGFLIMCLFYPLLNKVSFISGYTVLVYLFVLCSSIHSLFFNFIRAKGYVRLSAFDGISSTILTIILNVLFLVIFHMGVTGYVLGTILADVISSLFLFTIAKLYRYISIKNVEKETAAIMLKYCIPLIPTTVCSWIINISDRYLISHFINTSMTGLYSVANKIPTILLIVANIFGDAWQISAVTESDKNARRQFFSNVSNVYVSVAFLTGSFLIMSAKFITKLLASPSFYTAWQFIPILVMATTFACLSQFLGSVYMVGRKSFATLINTMIGAGLNIGLNLILIPYFAAKSLYLGVQAAAFSTFVSYFSMFVIKAFHTRRYIKIRWNMPKLLLDSVIITLQCYIMVVEVRFWVVYEILLFIASFVLNIDDVWKAFLKILPSSLKKKLKLSV